MLYRNINAAAGVIAVTAPARRAVGAENHRRTATKTTATVATPSRAWGASMLQLFSPKRRPDSSITQRAPGGLSTVMKLDASDEPKKKAFQLFVPA